jgi:hypothetical protein
MTVSKDEKEEELEYIHSNEDLNYCFLEFFIIWKVPPSSKESSGGSLIRHLSSQIIIKYSL